MYNPLDQFKIILLWRCCWNESTKLFLTNIEVYFVLVGFFIFLFFYLSNSNNSIINWNSYIIVVKELYFFVLNIFRSQVFNKDALKYFPLFFITFIFILFSNLLGLLPFGFTITSHIIQTFALAFSLFLGIFIIGFINFKLGFLNFFVPKGVPTFLIPFLIVIEIISYFIRPFSLSIRLFANMLAGHTLMYIISSFCLYLLKEKFFFFKFFLFFFFFFF